MADTINRPLNQFRWDNPVLQPDGRGNMVFTRYYQQAFSALFDAINAIPAPAELDLLGGLPPTGLPDGPTDTLLTTGSTVAATRSDDTFPSEKPPFPDNVLDALLALTGKQALPAGFQFVADTLANQGNYPPAQYFPALYLATNTYDWYRSNGAAWLQIIYPVLLYLGAADIGHGALARNGAGLESRLGDNSGSSFIVVADEAYGAGWNGSLQVPTKNAVYDKIESVEAEIAAVNVDLATKLTANGVNFGPGLATSITVVDGQVTAIS